MTALGALIYFAFDLKKKNQSSKVRGTVLSVVLDLVLQRHNSSASSSALPPLPSPYFLTLGFPCLSLVQSRF